MSYKFNLTDEVSFNVTGQIVGRAERLDRDGPQYTVRYNLPNGAVFHRTFAEAELSQGKAQKGA